MNDHLNHYQIDTERKAVSRSFFYHPCPVIQDLSGLDTVHVRSDDPEFPAWMQMLMKSASDSDDAM